MITPKTMRRPMVAHFSEQFSTLGHDADEPIRFTLFGTLAVRRSATMLALRLPRRAQRLLAYLLLNREREQSREHVAFTLWPDDDEADARANLRRQLHLLGRGLPDCREPWIVTTTATVAWNAAAPYRLDIADFERLCADPMKRAEADALYAGDLLKEAYDDWVVHERDRLRTLAMENLLSLIAHHQQRRDFTGAIRYAGRLRAIDPWREDAVRMLISLRYESGDRSGALAEYDRFRAALKAEFGVEPMPETACAYDRVAAGDGLESVRGATAAVQVSPAAAGRGLPFVNRKRELDALRADWTAATSGMGATALIAGEAGIGKSRLIDQLAALVEANGGRVIRGGTSPFEFGPYQVVAEALRGALPMLRDTKLEPVWLSVLATLVPQLQVEFPHLAQPAPLDAAPERTRLFEAIALAVGALAAKRPLMLVLEDLHWAGPATIALLEYLARRAGAQRLLIVVSYREDDLSRASPLRSLRRRLERERLLHTTAVGALGAADIEEIVAGLTDEEPARRTAIAGDLHALSDGNPFIVGELVINDRETGVLDDVARRWRRREAGTGELPSLTATLTERLDRLSPRSRSLAEIAAVIGRSFSCELVREVSGVDERTAIDGLEELVDRRLVRELDAVTGDFAFSHQLIQQTVYANMSPDARTRRHRRVGIVIEEIYGEQIEQFAAELATHYDQGCEPERAAEYYRLAARQALMLYGNTEAKSLASRGLDLALGAATRAGLFEILEDAHRRLGERTAQRATVTQMLTLAQSVDDPEMLREALRRKILLLNACAEREAERSAIASLEAQMAGARPPWPAVLALLRAKFLTAVGDYKGARRVLDVALGAAWIADYPRLDVDCRCALVELAGFDGRIEDLRAFLAQIALLDAQTYEQGLLTALLESACAAASRIQDYGMLARLSERLLESSRAIGHREGEAAAYKYAGRAALRLFEPARARTLLQQALEMFESIGQRLKAVHVLADIGNLATSIGKFDEAIIELTRAESISALISYGYGSAACANNISYAAYLKGDFDLARSAALRALSAAERIEAPSARAHALVSLGVAERELGDPSAAIAHLEEGVALERRLSEHIALGEDLCELILALLRSGDARRAQALSAEVLDLAANPDYEYTHPQYLLWTVAAARQANADSDGASDFLCRARAALDERELGIPDLDTRKTFRSLPYNRAIDAAFDHNIWHF